MENRRPSTEIQVRSDASECYRLRKIVSRLASARLHSSTAVGDVELAVGEAFSNAVKYGDEGKVSVRIDASSGERLVIEMCYPGSGFDTAVRYPGDTTTGSGGFGRYVMRQIVDSMEYYFQDGHTHLRMSKRV